MSKLGQLFCKDPNRHAWFDKGVGTLQIDLKDLPDIDVKVLPNGGVKSLPSAPNSVSTVQYQSGWKASLQKFQEEIMQAMMKLRVQIEYMKMKILEMKEEILKATA